MPQILNNTNVYWSVPSYNKNNVKNNFYQTVPNFHEAVPWHVNLCRCVLENPIRVQASFPRYEFIARTSLLSVGIPQITPHFPQAPNHIQRPHYPNHNSLLTTATPLKHASLPHCPKSHITTPTPQNHAFFPHYPKSRLTTPKSHITTSTPQITPYYPHSQNHAQLLEFCSCPDLLKISWSFL